MSQEEMYEWIEGVGSLIKRLAVVFFAFVFFGILMGYVYGEMSKSPAKANVPDCGKCPVYDKSKGVKK